MNGACKIAHNTDTVSTYNRNNNGIMLRFLAEKATPGKESRNGGSLSPHSALTHSSEDVGSGKKSTQHLEVISQTDGGRRSLIQRFCTSTSQIRSETHDGAAAIPMYSALI
eukprot:Colp12_sorted_trinity150504_noHs@16588